MPSLARLSEIQAEVERRAALIGASGAFLPTYGGSDDYGRPHIEVDDRGYHLVVVERGAELERSTTQSFEELLYHTFESITFAPAVDYELAHRKPREDCRRQIFAHQIDLMRQLDADWADRCAKKLEAILKQNPFQDR